MMKKLGFGTLRLPTVGRIGERRIHTEILQRMIDYFLAHGYTSFETSPLYSNGCEEALRHTLTSNHLREAFHLTNQLPLPEIETAEQQELRFYQQLHRCGVEYFDRYLIPCTKAAFYAHAERMESFRFLREQQSEGRVREIGISFQDSPELLDEILTTHPEITVVQLQLNYLDQEEPPIQGRRCREVVIHHRRRIVAMFPLKGGILSEPPGALLPKFREYGYSSPTEAALRYALSLKEVEEIVCDMASLREVSENIALFEQPQPLEEEKVEALDTLADGIRRFTPVQCTRCGYCLPACPVDIPIAENLWLLNEEHRNERGDKAIRHRAYRLFSHNRGSASECIECGRCEELCPQQLRIIEWLKQVTSRFEPISTATL